VSASFPTVIGSDLMRRKRTLPVDFEGEVNLVLIAFKQWQQSQIDTWLPVADHLEQTYDGFRYYELPVIQRLNFVARTFINEGMRAGIPDPSARSRTITLYVDKAALRRSLDLPDEDRIYELLVDRRGAILWRATGAYAPETARGLSKKVDSRFGRKADAISSATQQT
jgi:hypothetical protein